MDQLLLSCGALSSPTLCRFIPALSQRPPFTCLTQDTLGLHLASALRKKVVAVVGPTENREFSYGRVVSLKPDPRGCMPCNLPACKVGKECLSEITVECVADTVTGMLSGLNLHPELARKS